MTWLVLIVGTVIGCLCGMAVYNMYAEYQER